MSIQNKQKTQLADRVQEPLEGSEKKECSKSVDLKLAESQSIENKGKEPVDATKHIVMSKRTIHKMREQKVKLWATGWWGTPNNKLTHKLYNEMGDVYQRLLIKYIQSKIQCQSLDHCSNICQLKTELITNNIRTFWEKTYSKHLKLIFKNSIKSLMKIIDLIHKEQLDKNTGCIGNLISYTGKQLEIEIRGKLRLFLFQSQQQKQYKNIVLEDEQSQLQSFSQQSFNIFCNPRKREKTPSNGQINYLSIFNYNKFSKLMSNDHLIEISRRFNEIGNDQVRNRLSNNIKQTFPHIQFPAQNTDQSQYQNLQTIGLNNHLNKSLLIQQMQPQHNNNQLSSKPLRIQDQNQSSSIWQTSTKKSINMEDNAKMEDCQHQDEQCRSPS